MTACPKEPRELATVLPDVVAEAVRPSLTRLYLPLRQIRSLPAMS